MIYISNSQ